MNLRKLLTVACCLAIPGGLAAFLAWYAFRRLRPSGVSLLRPRLRVASRVRARPLLLGASDRDGQSRHQRQITSASTMPPAA